MPRPTLRAVAAAALFLVGYAGRAAGVDQKELSPGAVALLASHMQDPGVSEKVEAALASSRAETRAVAARVVNVGMMRSLVPRVVAALEKEMDAEPARELIRTVVSLGGDAFDETILKAAGTFSPKLDGHVARVFARTRGPEAIAFYFSTLHDLHLTTSDRTSFFRLATRGRAEDLTGALSRALGRRDEAAWQAILEVSADLPISFDQPVVISALRSDDAVFRGEAAWYLAKTHDRMNARGAAEALDAVSGAGALAPTPDPELRFGAEMLRRVLGKAAVEDDGWIACLESNPSCHLDTDFQASPLINYLTPRERAAIVRRNHGEGVQAPRPGEKPGQTPGRTLMRTLPGLPGGMARDLLAMTDCRSKGSLRLFSVAELTFRADGLPSHVTLRAAPSDTPCRNAAGSLLLMSLAPESEWIPPASTETYVALFDTDSIECGEAGAPPANAPESAAAEPVRIRTKIIAPILKKRVDPTYPEAARKNHEEGVSIYEAIIAPTGCVRDIRLLKSSSPLLDVTGMDAVSRWTYTPATLNDRPVSVYLTVTVTFNLRH